VLVLNRRQGESIVVEGCVVVRVLSVKGRTVWLQIAPRDHPTLVLAAAVHSPDTMRLEIAAPSSYMSDDGGIRVELAQSVHAAAQARATVSFLCGARQRVSVGDRIELAVSPSDREHPNLALRGSAIGDELRLALIRPIGNCIRIGVDAPGRRVYRKELWEALVAENTAAAEEVARGSAALSLVHSKERSRPVPVPQ
jgi:sRNA-binding carbon storage regulator CsrA